MRAARGSVPAAGRPRSCPRVLNNTLVSSPSCLRGRWHRILGHVALPLLMAPESLLPPPSSVTTRPLAVTRCQTPPRGPPRSGPRPGPQPAPPAGTRGARPLRPSRGWSLPRTQSRGHHGLRAGSPTCTRPRCRTRVRPESSPRGGEFVSEEPPGAVPLHAAQGEGRKTPAGAEPAPRPGNPPATATGTAVSETHPNGLAPVTEGAIVWFRRGHRWVRHACSFASPLEARSGDHLP